MLSHQLPLREQKTMLQRKGERSVLEWQSRNILYVLSSAFSTWKAITLPDSIIDLYFAVNKGAVL